MKKIIKKVFGKTFITMVLLSFFVSCFSTDNEPTIPVHEHEEITKVKLTFKNNENNETKYFEYIIIPGQTENPIVDININSGIYDVEIGYFSSDGDEQTDEIFIENGDEHFVFYKDFEGLKITYSDDDSKDSNDNKLGRKTTWDVRKEADMGRVSIYLLHDVAEKNPELPNPELLGGHVDIHCQFRIVLF